jgi:alkylation response protein AidB-like acyl-CoA dehydrogenase
VLAFALTGPEAGSDARALRMTCRRDGDRIRLAGTRSMVSGGSV